MREPSPARGKPVAKKWEVDVGEKPADAEPKWYRNKRAEILKAFKAGEEWAKPLVKKVG